MRRAEGVRQDLSEYVTEVSRAKGRPLLATQGNRRGRKESRKIASRSAKVRPIFPRGDKTNYTVASTMEEIGGRGGIE